MGRFRMWMYEMMRGRYGTDSLNKALLAVGLVLIILDMFIKSRLLNFIIVILLIYIYCRMFSRNISARSAENQRYLSFVSGLKSKSGSKSGSKDKTHKILRCPGCGEKLRVPKGAGKIMISCPYCKTKFEKKV